MVPVVLASTKSLLLYSAAPWVASGIAIGYMGKHFSTQNKLNLSEIKRQAEELDQLRNLQKDMQTQMSRLQAKLNETDLKKVVKTTTQTIQRKMNAGASSSNKSAFLKNLLDANVRLRENIDNSHS